MEMQEDTWIQHLVVVNAHTECNITAKQTLRQNATLHQTLHCNKSTAHCTAFVAAETRKNFLPPSCASLCKMASGFPPYCPLLGASTAKDSASWSHSGTEDLSVAVPFTHAGLNRSPDTMQEEILPLSNERGSGEVCAFPQKCRGLLSASTLGALPPNVFSCPAQM